MTGVQTCALPIYRILECSVAVENAVDTLKERVDWVTKEGHGEGTIELIQALVATDLSFLSDSGTAGKDRPSSLDCC